MWGAGLEMSHGRGGLQTSHGVRWTSNDPCGGGPRMSCVGVPQLSHVGEGLKWAVCGRASNEPCGGGLKTSHAEAGQMSRGLVG